MSTHGYLSAFIRVHRRLTGLRIERHGLAAAFTLVLAVALPACGVLEGPLLPDEDTRPVDTERFTLLTRFAHISDAQIMDEESPARLPWASGLVAPAQRPYEAWSTQLLDGFVRVINQIHASGETVDFVIHTGDAIDNTQANELRWFITVMDGGTIDPRSGPDDRMPKERPPPELDPHHPFEAAGLYRRGLHGPAATIEWYSLVGNHDRFAQGSFPIIVGWGGRLIAPMPLPGRIGIFGPLILDPLTRLAYGAVTPAHPAWLGNLPLPTLIEPNEARRFVTLEEFVAAHLESTGAPAGHGFSAEHRSRTRYSVSPVPGLRLIALNSSDPAVVLPGSFYPDGAISEAGVDFLRSELAAADRSGEAVIVATHHPSGWLRRAFGTMITQDGFRSLLNRHPSVVLHLAGHTHRNAVYDRGGYLEIETGSTLDPPQTGRIIEVWTDAAGGEVELRYRTFSHLDEIPVPPGMDDSPVFTDPLRTLRLAAPRE